MMSKQQDVMIAVDGLEKTFTLHLRDGLVLPVLATIAVWFFATGLIAWAANAPRESYGRSLIWAGVVGAGGMLCVIASARIAGVGGAYLGFAGAMAVWGWHEFAFLTGGVTGPRREPCPEGAQGIVRFAKASAAVLHHEIALAATAAILIALCWGQPNPIGAQVFVLLFALRLVAKLNLFAGVPNASTDILPRHLAYLTSYFGPNRFTALLALSIAGTLGVSPASFLPCTTLRPTPSEIFIQLRPTKANAFKSSYIAVWVL